MKAPALIVVDMLNDFLQAWAPAAKQRLVRSTNTLVGIVRDRHRPVIWVRQEFQPDLRDGFPEMRTKGIRITIQVTPRCQIALELAVAPSDAIIVKKRYSAFYGTALDQLPAGLKPDWTDPRRHQHSCLYPRHCHRRLSPRLGGHRGRGLRRFV